jgi:regulator of RNase E activity RraA
MTENTTSPAERARIIAALRTLDSCAISDALDSYGLPGAVTALQAMWPVGKVVAGRVRTVTAAAKTADGPSTHIATPLVVISEPDDVVVIDNNGRMDVSCWGGLLAEAAVKQGIAGVIVDGACRDVQECEALDLPLYARRAVPVSARGRIVQQAMDTPISIDGIAVETFDYVVADRNGIAFIKQADASRIVEFAQRIAEREERMSAEVRGGRPVVEVMHDNQFPSVEK